MPLTEVKVRVCLYCHQPCTGPGGAYAVYAGAAIGAACGPCYRREYGASAPHGHPPLFAGYDCPVCGEWVGGPL